MSVIYNLIKSCSRKYSNNKTTTTPA